MTSTFDIKQLIKYRNFNNIFNSVISLKRHSIKDRSNADGRGIYFLYKDNIIVYIGISQCIYTRLFGSREPHCEEKDFDSYSFINLELENRDLEFYEYELISLFKPKDNSQHRGFNNYQYLPIEYKNLKEDFDKKQAYKNALIMSSFFDYV